ncbi:MAG: globin domain-containing protein [Candidatus Kariarchaeaceae archaeon]|jgi:hemoglobin-like flavoprotein
MAIESPLSKEELKLIKATREKLLNNKVEFRADFYSRIFELDPATEKLFREGFLSINTLPDSFEFMWEHAEYLHNEIPAIKRLGLKHKTYKVKPKHYPIGEDALIWTLRKHLGDEFTEELGIAWRKLFSFVSEYLILGARRK